MTINPLQKHSMELFPRWEKCQSSYEILSPGRIKMGVCQVEVLHGEVSYLQVLLFNASRLSIELKTGWHSQGTKPERQKLRSNGLSCRKKSRQLNRSSWPIWSAFVVVLDCHEIQDAVEDVWSCRMKFASSARPARKDLELVCQVL